MAGTGPEIPRKRVVAWVVDYCNGVPLRQDNEEAGRGEPGAMNSEAGK